MNNINNIEKYIEERRRSLGEAERLSLGRSILGEDIECYKIGTGGGGVAVIGSNSATEYTTSLLLFDFMSNILDKLTRHSTDFGINIDFLLQKFTFWIIPTPNPDGRRLYLSGGFDNPLSERQRRMQAGDFSLWRANARGVDLDRNYRAGFFDYKRIAELDGIASGREGYSGEYPESEPESHALASFLRALSPRLAVTLSEEEKSLALPDSPPVLRAAARLCARAGVRASLPDGYCAHGTLCAYTASLGIPSFRLGVGEGDFFDSAYRMRVSDALRCALLLLPTYL